MSTVNPTIRQIPRNRLFEVLKSKDLVDLFEDLLYGVGLTLPANIDEKVPLTRTVNGKALSADISLDAADVGAPSGSGTSTGTNTGDQTITLTGDVTGSGTGSFAATVAPNAVTYAKLQDTSAGSVLIGRGASGAGDPQEITVGSGLVMTGTTLSAAGGAGLGDVTGPASSVDSNVALFNGTTGKVIKDSGLTLAGTNTGDQFTGETASTLIGRGAAAGAGPAQEITIGSGLTMTGTTLSASGGSGTVTSVSVASANGFAGTVATPGTTPTITLTTSLTGLLKGNGTAMSVAAAGSDYVAPGGALGAPSSGTLTNCTGLPISSGVSGLATGAATYLSSAAGFETMLANVTLGSAGTSLASGTITARKNLRIRIRIPGYAGSDTASLQFNGAAGTAYRYRWAFLAAGATTYTAGLTAASTDRIKIASANTTNSRVVECVISNDSTVTEKLVKFIASVFGTGSAATQATEDAGNGAWVSGASTQITSVALVSSSNMNAGTQMTIWGWD